MTTPPLLVHEQLSCRHKLPSVLAEAGKNDNKLVAAVQHKPEVFKHMSAITHCLVFRTWFWMSSFTRSIGAAAVLETAAGSNNTCRHHHMRKCNHVTQKMHSKSLLVTHVIMWVYS
jgi:hypothetical protein